MKKKKLKLKIKKIRKKNQQSQKLCLMLFSLRKSFNLEKKIRKKMNKFLKRRKIQMKTMNKMK